MRAQLHIQEQITNIDIDLPEAKPLAAIRARVDVYSNIDHVLWEAQLGDRTVQHRSTTVEPGASLTALYTQLVN
jgi:hypothetical protein